MLLSHTDSEVRPTDGAALDGTQPLDLRQGDALGHVVRLDHDRIVVEVDDPASAARVTVSDLVALPIGGPFVIGLVDSVVGHRSVSGSESDPTNGDATLLIMPVGTFYPGTANTSQAFTRGAPSYPHLGSSCHLVTGAQLRRFLALLGGQVTENQGLSLGHYVADHGAPAIADANRLFQRHVALLGSTGTGKSWAVSLILERVAELPHGNVIVFDLHGEYGPLAASGGGSRPVARRLRVAGPGDHGYDDDDVLYLPYWLLHRDELMTLVLNPSDPHAADQVFRFSEHVITLKRIALADAGREDATATFTMDSPVPYRLDHLVQMLRADDTEKIVKHPSNHVDPGPYAGRLTGFISRLEARAADPRYGFIFNAPHDTLRYEWFTDTAAKLLAAGQGDAGIKVIDVSEVPSAIVPMVVGVLARLVYEVQFWMNPMQRTPVCVVCDEAHIYLPAREESRPVHEPALQAFEAIAKEGRKYGVSLLLVSQRPTDVSPTILSQCNNFIVMRVTSDQDRSVIERMIPDTLSGVTRLLPILDVGEAVVVGDALHLPTRFKFDSPRVKPASATQPYWSLWSRRAGSEHAIVDSAEALRNQVRGDATASRGATPA